MNDDRLRQPQAIGLAVTAAVVGLMMSRAFDQLVWAAPAAGAAMIGVGYVLRRRPAHEVVLGLVAGTVLWPVIAVTVTGGTDLATFRAAFGPAARLMLSSEWPSPPRPALVGWVCLIVAGCASASVLLTRQPGARLAPSVPLVIAAVGATLLSAPGGVNGLGWGLLAGCVVFNLALGDRHVARRLADINAPAVALATTAVVFLAALGLPHQDRYNPRHVAPVGNTRELIPVEAFSAMRDLSTPVEFFRIERIEGGGADIGPFRVVAYDQYDGLSWTTDRVLQEIGSYATTESVEKVEYRVTLLEGSMRELPMAGAPAAVEGPILSDAESDLMVWPEHAPVGGAIEVATLPWPTPARSAPRPRARTDVDLRFAPAARELSGASPDASAPTLGQLLALSATMRSQWELEPGDVGASLQEELMLSFVTQTRRGTEAQFATAFALMARALGADARVAAGFTKTRDGVLSSEAAAVWPEVYFVDRGWVPFDPLPLLITVTDDADDVNAPGGVPSAQAPPDPVVNTPVDDDIVEVEAQVSPPAPTWVDRAVQFAVFVALVLAAAAAYAIGILGYKRHRRRQWLRADIPARRVRGGWAEVTSSLVDAGMDIEQSWTDSEIVEEAEQRFDSDQVELRRLGEAAQAATFSSREEPVVLAVDQSLVDDIDAIGRRIDAQCSRTQRWRRRLSTRSLRRSTASPVAIALRDPAHHE